jgi:hypothetical protein
MVTNDKTRDHGYQLLEDRQLNRWKVSLIINFDLSNVVAEGLPTPIVTCDYPLLYGREIQHVDGGWQLPIAKDTSQWLCITKNTRGGVVDSCGSPPSGEARPGARE